MQKDNDESQMKANAEQVMQNITLICDVLDRTKPSYLVARLALCSVLAMICEQQGVPIKDFWDMIYNQAINEQFKVVMMENLGREH